MVFIKDVKCQDLITEGWGLQVLCQEEAGRAPTEPLQQERVSWQQLPPILHPSLRWLEHVQAFTKLKLSSEVFSWFLPESATRWSPF